MAKTALDAPAYSSTPRTPIDLITSDQDLFVLLAFLRANNGPTRTFIAANALAKELGWGRKRLADTRKRLEGTYIEMVRRPSKAREPPIIAGSRRRRRVVRIDHLSSTNTFPSWVGLVYVGRVVAKPKKESNGYGRR